MRCVCGIFGVEFTKYTVIYGVCIRFWPSLSTKQAKSKENISALTLRP